MPTKVKPAVTVSSINGGSWSVSQYIFSVEAKECFLYYLFTFQCYSVGPDVDTGQELLFCLNNWPIVFC